MIVWKIFLNAVENNHKHRRNEDPRKLYPTGGGGAIFRGGGFLATPGSQSTGI